VTIGDFQSPGGFDLLDLLLLYLVQHSQSVPFSLTQGIRSVSMGPPGPHETGHFYFAQTGHSHFAATPEHAHVDLLKRPA
jgi:hypothetical protein